MDKYMTLEDVIKEFRTKITCDKTFDTLTEEEKKLFVGNKTRQIIRDLYDLRLKKIRNLSERDTYVFRRLYGILNSGKCDTCAKLEKELNLANVSGLKANFFKRVNRDIEKDLETENFTKKKMWFMNKIGVNLTLFKMNLVIFNRGKEDMLDVNSYLTKTPFETIKKELDTLVINIRNIEDLNKVNLNKREIQIIELWFGLNPQNYSFSLGEIAPMFEISRTRVSMIVNKAIEKIRNHYNILSEVDYFSSILCLNLSEKTFQILNKAEIKTIKALWTLSDECLMSLKGMGVMSFKEIKTALDNYEKNLINASVDIKKNRIMELMAEISDLEKERKELEDKISELDRLTFQAKNKLENLKNEVSNGR